LLVILLKF